MTWDPTAGHSLATPSQMTTPLPSPPPSPKPEPGPLSDLEPLGAHFSCVHSYLSGMGASQAASLCVCSALEQLAVYLQSLSLCNCCLGSHHHYYYGVRAKQYILTSFALKLCAQVARRRRRSRARGWRPAASRRHSACRRRCRRRRWTGTLCRASPPFRGRCRRGWPGAGAATRARAGLQTLLPGVQTLTSAPGTSAASGAAATASAQGSTRCRPTRWRCCASWCSTSRRGPVGV